MGKKDKLIIESVHAREILDSRGNPTVEVDVITKGGILGRASVPSGASTGYYEAYELRDVNSKRYMSKGVLKAVENVNLKIAPQIIGMNVLEQQKIDYTMIKLDNTKNKSNLGANAILGVSLAVLKAAAVAVNLPLYQYIGGVSATKQPVPMMNILNGGKHSDNNINIQEFMIVPVGAKNIKEAIRMCSEVFHTLKQVLKKNGYQTSVGDEGGFAPNLKKDEEAFELIIQAIEIAGYNTDTDFKLAIDVAATEMYEEAKNNKNEGAYYFWKSSVLYQKEELVKYYEDLVSRYPIISIEDGVSEDDFEAWELLTKKLGKKISLVGDDLFVTNIERLKIGIERNIANSILIKPNQIGTVTETINTIQMAQKYGYLPVISHRSGETEDTTIADLAVGLNIPRIKTGAPSRTDRVCKYNQLIRIEENII